MTADLVSLGGYLLLALTIGFASGLTIRLFRNLTNNI